MSRADIILIWIGGLTLLVAVVATAAAMILRPNILQVHAGKPKLSFRYGIWTGECVELWVAISNEPITNRLLFLLGVVRDSANVTAYMSTEKMDGSLSETTLERLHQAPHFELSVGFPVYLTVVRWRKLPPIYVDKPFTGMYEEQGSDTNYLNEGEYNLYMTVRDADKQQTWRKMKQFAVLKDSINWIG